MRWGLARALVGGGTFGERERIPPALALALDLLAELADFFHQLIKADLYFF